MYRGKTRGKRSIVGGVNSTDVCFGDPDCIAFYDNLLSKDPPDAPATQQGDGNASIPRNDGGNSGDDNSSDAGFIDYNRLQDGWKKAISVANNNLVSIVGSSGDGLSAVDKTKENGNPLGKINNSYEVDSVLVGLCIVGVALSIYMFSKS